MRGVARRAFWVLLSLPVAALGALAVAYVDGQGSPSALRLVLSGLFAVTAVGSAVARPRPSQGFGVGVVLLVGVCVWWSTRQPRTDRNWATTQSRAPWAEIDGTKVTVHDIRDFRYRSADEWDARWYDATFDLAEIERAYFVLTRFADFEGVAHVMISFRFSGDRYLVLSAEIRREEGERYDPLAGLFRQYELMYVAADERDAIALRTNVYDDSTWVIPVDAGPEKTGAFFMDMVRRMNALHDRPEWYNTLSNSCSTNLADHYEAVNDVRLPPDHRIVLPGFSDRVIDELGLLPPGVTREAATDLFLVNETANAVGVTESFSADIRDWQ